MTSKYIIVKCFAICMLFTLYGCANRAVSHEDRVIESTTEMTIQDLFPDKITKITIDSYEENWFQPYVFSSIDPYFGEVLYLLNDESSSAELFEAESEKAIWNIVLYGAGGNVVSEWTAGKNLIYNQNQAFVYSETVKCLLLSLSQLDETIQISIQKSSSQLKHHFNFNTISENEKYELLNILYYIQSAHKATVKPENNSNKNGSYIVTIWRNEGIEEYFVETEGFTKNGQLFLSDALFDYLEKQYRNEPVPLSL